MSANANVEIREEEEEVPPAAEFVELGEDGEEIEYAEFTIEELQRQAAALKAEIASLVEDVAEDLS